LAGNRCRVVVVPGCALEEHINLGPRQGAFVGVLYDFFARELGYEHNRRHQAVLQHFQPEPGLVGTRGRASSRWRSIEPTVQEAHVNLLGDNLGNGQKSVPSRDTETEPASSTGFPSSIAG